MSNQSRRNKLEDVIQKNLMFLLVAFLLMGIAAACVVLFSYYGKFGGMLSKHHDVWGQFGDFVGGSLNPLFAFLSFVALLMTLLIQNKELTISSDELKKSTEALTQQSKALDLQNFERTFFELVRLHHELVNGIVDIEARINFSDTDRFRRETIKHQGRECFSRFYGAIGRYYGNFFDEEDKSKTIQGRIEEAYNKFVSGEKNPIDHYFRNLYHIFKFIDGSDVNHKSWYASIVRAQLSNSELCLLFYNALLPQNINFKKIIEKYALLENMNFDELMDKEQHLLLYTATAYGEAVSVQKTN